MKSAIETPFLLQAIIYAGSSYRYYFGSRDPAIDYARIHSYQETLKHLRESIQNMDEEPPDEILLAIALLAMHGSPKSPPRQPLTNKEHYRDLEFYFSKPWEPSHIQALTSLTRRKGGLKNISMDCVAAMIFVYVTAVP